MTLPCITGLLTNDDLVRATEIDPRMPKSRKLLAIPFVGKVALFSVPLTHGC